MQADDVGQVVYFAIPKDCASDMPKVSDTRDLGMCHVLIDVDENGDVCGIEILCGHIED